MNFFELINKPKIQLSLLDDLILFAHFFLIVILCVSIWAYFRVRSYNKKKEASRRKHSEHCPCFKCLGIKL